jgi:choline dehydrogenase
MSENKKSKKLNQIKRRDFIKSSIAVGVTGALGSCAAPLAKRSGANVETETVYDFIIVGTGAGGAPLAARLARYGYSVLCLEAGKNSKEITTSVPAYHGISTEDPKFSWNFFIRHNQGPNAMNLDDSKFEESKGGILYPRASAIGGCTIHNAMITMTPDNNDWERLKELSGDSSWGHRNMRRYFKKVERNEYKPISLQTLQHGFRGWLGTSQNNLKFMFDSFGGSQIIRKTVLACAHEWGLDIVGNYLKKGVNFLDTNSFQRGPKLEGIYRVATAISKGRRTSPKEWLLATQKRFDLDIVTNALVSKVLMKKDTKGEQLVYGVECLISEDTPLYKASPLFDGEKVKKHKTKVFKARKEVILAGGAFNTPQMMMLSGLGDKQELEKLGIETKVHLPGVGKNLQDRYEIGVVTELNQSYKGLRGCTFEPAEDPCLDEYKRNPQKHIYSENGVILGNMVRSRHSKKSEDPDLFIFATPGDFRGYKTNWSKEALSRKDRLTWAILKAKTSNTSGTVKLRSTNPMDVPKINFNNFTDGKADLEAMVDGVNFARKLNSHSPLKDITNSEIWPPKKEQGNQLEDFILKEAWGHHASCTCPMGGKVQDGAVVDFDFKVHGTKNLRIVDASVFPKIPGHFIAMPIFMIAEKAAEVIHRKYR